MKKILISYFLSTIFIIILSINGIGQTTQKPIELNFAISDPPTHFM